MKERETEKIALGEEEATRPETRSLEECGVDRCEWNTGDGRCNYYGLTGRIRPCGTGDACEFAGSIPVGGTGKASREDIEERLWLYEQGMTDRQIAEQTGASIQTIQGWRYKRVLPPNRGRRKASKGDAPEPPGEKVEDIPKRQDKKKAEPLPAAGRYFRVLLADGTEIRTRGVGIAASVQTVGVLDGDEMVAWFPLSQVRGIYAEAEA